MGVASGSIAAVGLALVCLLLVLIFISSWVRRNREKYSDGYEKGGPPVGLVKALKSIGAAKSSPYSLVPISGRADSLSGQGALDAMKKAGIKCILTSSAGPPPSGSVALIGCAYDTSEAVKRASSVAMASKGRLLTLPSSFDMTSKGVRELVKILASKGPIMCADHYSLDEVKLLVPDAKVLLVKHSGTEIYKDRLKGISPQGWGILRSLREGEGCDREATLLYESVDNHPFGPLENNGTPGNWRRLLEGVSTFESIETDVVDVAIAAILLGRPVTVFPGSKDSTHSIIQTAYPKGPAAVYVNPRDPDELLRKYMENSYVTSLDDDVSRTRLEAMRTSHARIGLPEAILNPALHYSRHASEISRRFPYLDSTSEHFQARPGAYGLAASLCQFLETALERAGDDLDGGIMWYEDDAVPGDDTQLVRANLALALGTLPVSGNDVYFLSRNTYCRGCKSEPRWAPSSDWQYGTAAVLFSVTGAQAVLGHIQTEGTGMPIDLLISYLANVGKINSWDWEGNAVSENPMFCGIFKQYEVFCSHAPNGGRALRKLTTMGETEVTRSIDDDTATLDPRRSPPQDTKISRGPFSGELK